MSNPHQPPTGYEPPSPGQPAPTGYDPTAGYSTAPGQGPPSAYQPPDAYQAPGTYQAGQNAYQTPGLYGPPPAGYPMPQPYYPYPYMPPREHEGLAIASLVVSCAAVLGLCTSGFAGVLGIVGAILGHVARSRIKRTGKAGGGMALAGIIVGWVLTAVCAVLVALVVVMFVHDANTSGTPV